MNTEKALITIMVALEAVHGYSAFMPSAFTIRTFALGDEQKIAELRSGYLPSITIAVAMGWIASEIVSSYYPLLAVMLTSGIMVTFYEWSIRRQ